MGPASMTLRLQQQRGIQMSTKLRTQSKYRVRVVVVAMALLALGGFSASKAMQPSPARSQQTNRLAGTATLQQPDTDVVRASAEEAVSAVPIFADRSQKSFASEPTTKLTPIEAIQVWQRVGADSPTNEVDLRFGKTIVPDEWRKLTLSAPKRDGTTADVVLLRPLNWLNEQNSEVGGTVFISVPECGIDGHAQVLAIDPCPEIIVGRGQVVTGTFRHQVPASISLSIGGQAEPGMLREEC